MALDTIIVCLTKPVGAALQQEAIRRCDAGLRNWLRSAVIREEIDPAVLDDLLDHPDSEVSRAVAVSLEGAARGSSPRTREKWEAAVVRCPADFELGRVLADRTDLTEKWVDGWLKRQSSDGPTYEPIPDSLLPAIRALPIGSRGRLLEGIQEGTSSLFVDDLVAVLAGDDEDLVRLVFTKAELKRYRRATLRGKPTESWLRRARVALELGYSEEQVGAACIGGMMTWSGPESAYWDGWVEDFSRLGELDDPIAIQLSESGVRIYGQRRDIAVEEERKEERHG